MSQRDSGYERKERDLYETPAWVTEALVERLPFLNGGPVWEPAAGGGKMVAALRGRGLEVVGTDIADGLDFLEADRLPLNCKAIITNPPYVLAREFIDHALRLFTGSRGVVAMLLRTDFDHAKTREDLFRDHSAFAKKLVLTRRIKWFEDSKGQPSFNHAWFIWNWKHDGPPTLDYAP